MERFNLGVYGSHNSSIAISLGGKILEVVELERWIGVKNAAFFYYFPVENPKELVDEILDYFEEKYGAKQYDWVMVNSWPQENIDWFRATNHMYLPHHIAHATNALYQQDKREALIISFDGGSDEGHFNIYNATKGQVPEKIFASEFDLCVPYAAMGQYIKEINHEDNAWIGNLVYAGKVMGLSGYGKRDEKILEYSKQLFERQKSNDINVAHTNWQDIWCGCVHPGNVGRDLAWSTQHTFERKFAELALPFILNKKPEQELIFTGGGAMNILNNTLYKAFVPPNPDDRGIALGCLLHLIMSDVDSTYLGSEPYDKMPLSKTHTVKQIVGLLNKGKILGLIQGRAEHGARALGNRSILCLPTKKLRDKLNKKVKNREEFRPFAAVCRKEDANKYFRTYDMHRWMTHNTIVRDKELDGVTHVDGTTRLQTVTEEQNPFLYELLGHIPVLLNTSFNIQGKPILNTYKDALWMKKNTGIDEVITDKNIL
jgi:carbamoyltransferase